MGGLLLLPLISCMVPTLLLPSSAMLMLAWGWLLASRRLRILRVGLGLTWWPMQLPMRLPSMRASSGGTSTSQYLGSIWTEPGVWGDLVYCPPLFFLANWRCHFSLAARTFSTGVSRSFSGVMVLESR